VVQRRGVVEVGRTPDACAKPTLESACFRLQNHRKRRILQARLGAVFVIIHMVAYVQAPAWGARGRVFESLRPDHIFQ
jgi:hypothetical protein